MLPTEKGYISNVPFPYLNLDSDLNILGISNETMSHFPNADNFLDLVDLDSRKKATKFIKPNLQNVKIELNMMTMDQPITLYDIFVQWDDENTVNVFCIKKQESIVQIQEIVQRIEDRMIHGNLTTTQQQEELEQTLQKMEEIISQQDDQNTLSTLLHTLATEVKEPLSNVKGFINLMKTEMVDPDDSYYAEVALDELEKANNIIYQFIVASSPPEPNFEQVSIQKLLSQWVYACKDEVELSGYQIKYVKEQILPNLAIDTKQIKQVLLNLIKNSIEAMDRSTRDKKMGQIIIRTRLTHKGIQISVSDNGIGMDVWVKKKLFTPFFSTKEKGVGKGLSVCRKIIHNHGGSLDVDSTLGQGSTFYILLPISE
ncbi:ATP-binding protein [Aquibacillus koreensis]|uniref:histidine kinase n=1 Tax=Aquibacillus koreensis TaxID=279446 RepID=A0A9X3WSM5_9BACI|nr:ATP-binding protein [Aquibacillus koreensis]MCT2536660.1 ATP-binding protein [Aquibacillus koreensis]MDC3422614.1 ATP-binding protein [Aquibacillus koreensis]